MSLKCCQSFGPWPLECVPFVGWIRMKLEILHHKSRRAWKEMICQIIYFWQILQEEKQPLAGNRNVWFINCCFFEINPLLGHMFYKHPLVLWSLFLVGILHVTWHLCAFAFVKTIFKIYYNISLMNFLNKVRYPTYTPVLHEAIELWCHDPAVTTPVLKLMAELAQSR